MGSWKGGGNPDIADPEKVPRTGAKTDMGKFWQNIKNYSLNTTAKTVKKVRKCSKCPLGPITTESGKRILRCQYWDPKREEDPEKENCVIPTSDFIMKCRMLRKMQKKGMEELAKFNAVETMAYSELAFQRDMLIEGAPGDRTAQFKKIAGDQIHKTLKITKGEKHNVSGEVRTLDITEMIQKEQEQLENEDGDIMFDDEDTPAIDVEAKEDNDE